MTIYQQLKKSNRVFTHKRLNLSTLFKLVESLAILRKTSHMDACMSRAMMERLVRAYIRFFQRSCVMKLRRHHISKTGKSPFGFAYETLQIPLMEGGFSDLKLNVIQHPQFRNKAVIWLVDFTKVYPGNTLSDIIIEQPNRHAIIRGVKQFIAK